MRESSSARPGARPPRRNGFVPFLLLVTLVGAGVGWWRSGGFDAGPAAARASGTPSWGDATRPVVEPGRAAAAVDRFAELGYPVRCGGGNERVVALTFDDGPGPYTEQTLDLLETAGVRATYFLNGVKLEDRFLHLPRREAAIGAVGNHTWNHVEVTDLSSEGMVAEIDETSRVLQEGTGVPISLFRPPFGAYDETSQAHVRALGMVTVLWSVDSGDAAQDATGSVEMATLRDEIRPGSIILLHENRGSTQHVLPNLLRVLARRDLRPVTVPELLAIDPPSMDQLRSGTCPPG